MKNTFKKQKWLMLLGSGVAICGSLKIYETMNADASEFVVHPHKHKWSHSGIVDSLDMSSSVSYLKNRTIFFFKSTSWI
jgi:hypothetical protein